MRVSLEPDIDDRSRLTVDPAPQRPAGANDKYFCVKFPPPLSDMIEQ